jgi:tetrahydromethanopterin S-methyltransferase subunit B
MASEPSIEKIIELVDKLISNLDPTPTNINSAFPLRWESNIFIEDYDFSENFLDLDQNYEYLNGKYLKSVGI